jgi:hypothetical protein
MLKNGHAWHFTTYDKRPEFAKVRKNILEIYYALPYIICRLRDLDLLCDGRCSGRERQELPT